MIGTEMEVRDATQTMTVMAVKLIAYVVHHQGGDLSSLPARIDDPLLLLHQELGTATANRLKKLSLEVSDGIDTSILEDD